MDILTQSKQKFILIAFGLSAALFTLYGQTATETFTSSTSSSTFTVPTGVTAIKVEAWGGGGRGASRTSGLSNGYNGFGGGGGGAYASGIVQVTQGSSYPYAVGRGSSSTSDGGSSTFNTNTVIAVGGKSAANNSRSGAAGGLASASTIPSGGTKYNGGTGGTGTDSSSGYSGGGGGGAGSNGAGGNANGITAGIGTSQGGGTGGTGRSNNGNGYSGATYGGGGGGAFRVSGNPPGGTGANGAIRITYLSAPIVGDTLIKVGGTTKLTNVAAGGTWSSLNPGVATVNTSGLVTGVTTGSAEIVYTTADKLARKVTVKVLSKNAIIIDVCEGSPINLAASLPGDWVWMGPENYFSTNPDPRVTSNADPSMEGIYIGGPNLLINGNFEQGYIPGVFQSNYTKGNGNSNSLEPEGVYEIGTSPKAYHSNFTNCPDHSGNGNQMIVNGAIVPNTLVWRQTVTNLSPNSDYRFSYWIQTVEVASNPATIQFQLGGVNQGSVFEAPRTKECGNWKQFTYIWNSGDNTSIELSLLNTNVTNGGNDFALDDIVFNKMDFTDTVYIRVADSFTPKVTINADIDPVPTGVKVTYTANPLHGGLSPIYQWKVNGIEVLGATAATFDYVAGINDVITCEMTSSLGCASPQVTLSNEIAVTVKNYWYGTTSEDWGTESNWTANRIPANGQDVEYATTDNNSAGKLGNGLGVAIKDLHLDIDRSIGSLINLTDKKLVIPTEKSLTVNSNINTGGNNRILIKAGEAVANGSLIFPNETNPVFATVEMYSKAWIADASGNPGGKPTGTIADNERIRWQYFGIPLKTLTASPAFDGSWVRIWNEAKETATVGKQWVFLTNTSVMNPFQGYEITHPTARSFSLSGQLTNRSLVDTTLKVTPGSYYRGQHILANPYTAAINIDNITFGTGMEKVIYIFNTGSFSDWKTGVGSGGTKFSQDIQPGQYLSIPQKQANYIGQITIPSMQGFLVKVVGEGVTEGHLSINYPSVAHKNDRAQRVKQNMDANEDTLPAEGKTYTTISMQSERYHDRLWLFAEENCSPAFDNGWDGPKIVTENTGVAQLFAMEESGNYQVNSTYDINDVYLGFKGGVGDTDYQLHFQHTNLSERYESLYLLDLVTGTVIDISADDSQYSFSASNILAAEKRFKIVANLKNDDENEDDPITTYIENQMLYVLNYNKTGGKVLIYDTLGRMLMQSNFESNGVTPIPFNLPTGYYVVEAACDGKKASKILINNSQSR